MLAGLTFHSLALSWGSHGTYSCPVPRTKLKAKHSKPAKKIKTKQKWASYSLMQPRKRQRERNKGIMKMGIV